jgi:hypothetical protein
MTNLAVQFSGTVVDGMSIPGNVLSYISLPEDSTLLNMQAAVGVWAAAVDDCIDGAFQEVFATLTPTLPGGLKAATGATWLASRIAQTGSILFSATGTSRRFGQALPALANATIVGSQLDITNAAIQALITLMLNPTVPFSNVQSESLVAALDALLSFRKYRVIGLRSTRV